MSAEVTRKLLVVEVTNQWADDFIRDLPKLGCCRVYELPCAAELGQVAICAKRPAVHSDSCACVECERIVGQAILGALTKRTGGGDAK